MVTPKQPLTRLFEHVANPLPGERFIVTGGFAKSGTTLLITLLDGHPDLVVFPEELRFFHHRCDRRDGMGAAEALLACPNIQNLAIDRMEVGETVEYRDAGVGEFDYSALDFDLMNDLVRGAFRAFSGPRDRLRAVFGAYLLAQGKDPRTSPAIYTSKAPHNEIFMHRWQRTLGRDARYVISVRDPVELYYSLSKVSGFMETKPPAPAPYARNYVGRYRRARLMAPGQVFFQRYEELTTDSERCIREIAEFCGIPADESLFTPTKNGVPWSGNSTRGLRGAKVFKNPMVAREKLPAETVSLIERKTASVARALGYEAGGSVGLLERVHDQVHNDLATGWWLAKQELELYR